MPDISLLALPGIPPVQPGDDLEALITAALERRGLALDHGDIVVVASKIVSKAEGRVVDLATVKPSARAEELAGITGKDARIVELALGEATAIVRAVPNVLLTTHRLGFTSANAGIDRSNVGLGSDDVVLLLPEQPDESAERLRQALADRFGTRIGVVIADTHGRPFRRGNVGVAIGVAGIPALVDSRGDLDLFDRVLEATFIPVADAVAAAAALVTGEAAEGLPVVVVRGVRVDGASGTAADLVRSRAEDLFASPEPG